MKTPTLICPACGSEKITGSAAAKTEAQIAKGTPIAESEVCVYLTGARREAWKDRVGARSRIEARVCLRCGYISFFATDLAALREADAKINN